MDYALGFFIATAIGLTGVGGGTLTTPLLILLLGVPAPEAVGTSLLFVTFSKILATPVYLLRGQVDRRIAGLLLLGGLPGVVVGSLTLARMRSARLEPIVLTIVGATVAIVACVGLWKLLHSHVSGTRELPKASRERWLPWLAAPIGMEVGFSSAGAGALGTLLLLECTSLSTGAVVGTDLLFGLIISAVGGGLHLALGVVNRVLVLHLCIGGVAGAALGAWLGSWLPARPLRTALTAFLVFLGGQLTWRGLQALIR